MPDALRLLRACIFLFNMKTNVILSSQSRLLFDVTIRQQTKTGFLNLSDLELAYASDRIINSRKERGRVQDIIAQKENAERIFFVLKETGIINSDISEFIEMCQEDGMVKTLKKLGVYKVSGARDNKTIWCNPYIWVLVAMELSPTLYAKTVVWLTDRLVFNRIESGEMYKGLTKSVSVFFDVDYPALARALNHVVFGKHETAIRNTGSEEQLHELQRLENNLSFSIDAGFIKSFPALMEQIRDIWRKKYNQIY